MCTPQSKQEKSLPLFKSSNRCEWHDSLALGCWCFLVSWPQTSGWWPLSNHLSWIGSCNYLSTIRCKFQHWHRLKHRIFFGREGSIQIAKGSRLQATDKAVIPPFFSVQFCGCGRQSLPKQSSQCMLPGTCCSQWMGMIELWDFETSECASIFQTKSVLRLHCTFCTWKERMRFDEKQDFRWKMIGKRARNWAR